MKTYTTSEVAAQTGVHPNTVRLYEKIGFITTPLRRPNGYRVYTLLHISQMRLARTAMRAEVLQNGLRQKAVEVIRFCAASDISAAELAAREYLKMIDEELIRADIAASAVEKILANKAQTENVALTRKQASRSLGITTDTLRNWELNGLMQVKRKTNGYRVYNGEDMVKLSVIRTLRCANYSLSSILRLMTALSERSSVCVSEILSTPKPDEEIISVCDKLTVSLKQTRVDAESIISQLAEIEQLL